MTKWDFSTLITHVQSTKAKERNDALAELSSMENTVLLNRSRDKQGQLAVKNLAKACLESLSLEKQAYIRGETVSDPQLLRIHRLSTFVRRLSQNVLPAEQFKNGALGTKRYEGLVSGLADLILWHDKRHGTDHLFKPACYNIVTSLCALLEMREYACHLNANVFSRLVLYSVRCINSMMVPEQIEEKSSDFPITKITVECFRLLQLVLHCDAGSGDFVFLCNNSNDPNENYYLKMVSAIERFHKEGYSTNVSSVQIVVCMFGVINAMLPGIAKQDLSLARRLCRIALCFIRDTAIVSRELAELYVTFSHICFYFVAENHLLREHAVHLLYALNEARVDRKHCRDLSPSMIRLNQLRNKNCDLFHFSHSSVASSEYFREWSVSLALAKSLIAYHIDTMNGGDLSTEDTLKRSRRSLFTLNLRENCTGFLEGHLNSSDTEHVAFAFQMMFFMASYSSTNHTLDVSADIRSMVGRILRSRSQQLLSWLTVDANNLKVWVVLVLDLVFRMLSVSVFDASTTQRMLVIALDMVPSESQACSMALSILRAANTEQLQPVASQIASFVGETHSLPSSLDETSLLLLVKLDETFRALRVPLPPGKESHWRNQHIEVWRPWFKKRLRGFLKQTNRVDDFHCVNAFHGWLFRGSEFGCSYTAHLSLHRTSQEWDCEDRLYRVSSFLEFTLRLIALDHTPETPLEGVYREPLKTEQEDLLKTLVSSENTAMENYNLLMILIAEESPLPEYAVPLAVKVCSDETLLLKLVRDTELFSLKDSLLAKMSLNRMADLIATLLGSVKNGYSAASGSPDFHGEALERRTTEELVVSFISKQLCTETFVDFFLDLLPSLSDQLSVLRCFEAVLDEVMATDLADHKLWERIVRQFAETVLVNYELERLTGTVVCCSKLVCHFFRRWSEVPDYLRADVGDICRFVLNVHAEGLILFEDGIVQILPILAVLSHKKPPELEEFTDRALDAYFDVISECKSVPICLQGSMHWFDQSYAERSSTIVALHSRFLSCCELPDRTVSLATVYMSLERMAELCDTSLVFAVADALRFANRDYLTYSLSVMKGGHESYASLFDLKAEPLLKTLYLTGFPLEDLFASIHDCDTGNGFFDKWAKSVVALTMAFENGNSKRLLDFMCKRLAPFPGTEKPRSPSELLDDASSTAIALAFTEGGIRSDVFDLIKTVGKKHKWKSGLGPTAVQTVAEILRLSNYSSESRILAAARKLGLDAESLSVFSADAAVLDLPKTTTISTNTTLESIKAVILYKFEDELDFWTPSTVRFLLLRVLAGLETRLLPEYKVSDFRHIKLLFILAREAFRSETVLDVILRRVVPYLVDPHIGADVAAFLAVFMVGHASTPRNYTGIVRFLLELKVCGQESNEQLVEVARNASFEFPLGLHAFLVNWGLQSLTGSHPQLKPTHVLAILNEIFSGKVQRHEHPAYFSILSSVAALGADLPSLPLPSKELMLWLSKECHSSLSEQFLLWVGKQIGDYYMDHGSDLATSPSSNDNMFPDYKVANLDLRLTFWLLSECAASSSAEFEFLFGTVVSFLQQDNDSAAGLDFLKITGGSGETHVAPECMDLRDFDCGWIADIGAATTSLNNLQELYPLNRCLRETAEKFSSPRDRLRELKKLMRSENAAKDIVKYVLQDISPELPVAVLLLAIYDYVPEAYSRRVFTVLLAHLAYTNFSGYRHTMESLVRDLGSSMSDTALSCLCDFALVIRKGACKGDAECSEFYTRLDLISLSKVCRSLNPKAALMFYEDCKPDERDEGEDWAMQSSIYAKINEEDLLYGLPVPTSVSQTQDLLFEITKDPMKRLMLANAELGSSFAAGREAQDTSRAVQSMRDSGLKGISKVVSGAIRSEDDDGRYDWAWKLNQWDLEPPSDTNSLPKFIFAWISHLKESETPRPDKFVRDLFESKEEILGPAPSVRQVQQWCSAWAILSSGLQISSLDSEHYTIEADHFEERCRWLEQADIDALENLCLARRAIYQVRAPFLADSNAFFEPIVFEMARFADITRAIGETPRSLETALHLEKLVDDTFLPIPDHRNQYPEFLYRGMATFQVAASLWGLTDASFSIESVKNIKFTERPSVDGTLLRHSLEKRELPRPYLDAFLVKWMAESKYMAADQILEEYVLGLTAHQFVDRKKEAFTYHTYAEFCYTEYYSKSLLDQLSHWQNQGEQHRREFDQLKVFVDDVSNGMEQRKSAAKALKIAKAQYLAAREESNRLTRLRSTFHTTAECYYARSLVYGDEFDHTDVDRYCALWLDDTARELEQYSADAISSAKMLSWVNQIISRLSTADTPFAKSVKQVLVNMCTAYPQHTLYQLQSLLMTDIVRGDAKMADRIQGGRHVWDEASKAVGPVASQIRSFCIKAVELSKQKVDRKTKVSLSSMPSGRWWKTDMPKMNITPPTVQLPVSNQHLPVIVLVSDEITVADSGISMPKILKFKLSNGAIHRMLFKSGSDDLRQDSIMEQVFEKINILFGRDREAKRRQLTVRTYKVAPLGTQSGIIEFVGDSVSLNTVLYGLHKQFDKCTLAEARKFMSKYQNDTREHKTAKFGELCQKIQPVMRKFFAEQFVDPEGWFRSRLVYTRGVATTSIAGYVLGLGDRHNNNILLDKHTGEPIHIDLGIAFDQGKLLPIPETVPFRLTRDIVDGFGVTGTRGVFSKSCEHTFRVLRQNGSNIKSILDVLRYDPLYRWTVSPLRLLKIQNEADVAHTSITTEAKSAVEGVLAKLDASGLSEEAVVRRLIAEARDPANLAQLYFGWSPFY